MPNTSRAWRLASGSTSAWLHADERSSGLASADDPRWLEKIANRVAHGTAGPIALDGSLDVALSPLICFHANRWPWPC